MPRGHMPSHASAPLQYITYHLSNLFRPLFTSSTHPLLPFISLLLTFTIPILLLYILTPGPLPPTPLLFSSMCAQVSSLPISLRPPASMTRTCSVGLSGTSIRRCLYLMSNTF